MNLKFNIKDKLTPDIRRKLAAMKDPRPVSAAMGKSLEVELRAVFCEINARPNKMGWPKRNFWKRNVADKIALTSVEQRKATVTIASPELMHKITGGDVTPKRGKTLAIPANAQAYKMGGPRASGRDFQFLLLAQGNLVGALINPETYSVAKKKGSGDNKLRGGEVMYWLVRKVTHKPDPSVNPDLPPIRPRLMAAVSKAAAAAITRLFSAR